jgi:hypothetical protein
LLGFQPFAFGDVARQAGDADQVAGGVPHGKAPVMNPAERAVRPGDLIFHAHRGFAVQESGEGGADPLTVGRPDGFEPLFRSRAQAFTGAAPD